MNTSGILVTYDSVFAKRWQQPGRHSYLNRSPLELEVVGVYDLIDSFDINIETNETIRSRGKTPIGTLSYDMDGGMAVQIMNDGRERLGGLDPEVMAEKIKAAFENYTAYFGTFQIHEAEGYVEHHIRGSLSPDEEGKVRKRFFELSGTRLTLTTPVFDCDGEKRVRHIIWERRAPRVTSQAFISACVATVVTLIRGTFRVLLG
jgi:hypothetical protein